MEARGGNGGVRRERRREAGKEARGRNRGVKEIGSSSARLLCGLESQDLSG